MTNSKHTIIIDILNEKALSFLENMESQNLIRIKKNNTKFNAAFKGAMQKQPLDEIDRQLKELRESW